MSDVYYRIEWKLLHEAALDGYLFSMEKPSSTYISNTFSVEFTGFIARKPGVRNPKVIRLSFRVKGVTMLRAEVNLPRRDLVSDDEDDLLVNESDYDCGFSINFPMFLSERSRSVIVYCEGVDLESGSLLEWPIMEIGLSPICYGGSSERLEEKLGVVSVSSIGRSGSTVLCRMLGMHPECYAPKYQGQYGEMNPIDFYLKIISTLSSEGSPYHINRYERQGESMSIYPSYLKPDVSGAGGALFHERMRKINTSASIDLFYKACEEVRLLMGRQKPQARLWVEKQWANAYCNIGRSLLCNYNEIFLVRNMRDFWRSQMLYHKKLRTPLEVYDEHVNGTMEKYENILAAYFDRSEKALLVRYEDLVGDPGITMERICDHLKINFSKYYANECKSVLNGDDVHTRESRTSDSGDFCDESYDKYISGYSAEYLSHIGSLLSRVGYSI
jgi:Sulfotransferase family